MSKLSKTMNPLVWIGIPALLITLSTNGIWLRERANPEAHSKATNPARYVKSIYPPRTFDPKDANDVASISVNNLIYSGLLEFTPDLRLQGDLAESWRTSTDGRALFFTLRRGLKFHDGSPVSSQNVVASLSRLMQPTSRVYSYYESIEGAKEFHSGRVRSVKGLIVVSARDLIIRLQYPFSPFASILAGATAKVLPMMTLGKESKNFFNTPVGTGPFRFIQANKEMISLSRFDDYHGLKPHITSLILDLSPNPLP